MDSLQVLPVDDINSHLNQDSGEYCKWDMTNHMAKTEHDQK